MKYVVIGNSAAGINAIEAIRKVDKIGEIINISAEPYQPYSRPLLSYLLAGKISEDRVYFRPPSFYKDYNVNPILGEKVVEVNATTQSVTLAGGRKVSYDKLLVATGRSPGRLRIQGIEDECVYNLIKFDDAKAILEVLPEAKGAVVIGSGLIGLKAAEALRIVGLEVSVVEIEDRILPLAIDKMASEILTSALEANGIKFFMGNSAKEIKRGRKGEVVGVSLGGGQEVPAELVIVAAGMAPNFGFLLGTEARVNIGVIVDRYLETTAQNIYAAGDVSESKDIITGRSNLSAVWPRASEQGYYAGLNMAGFEKEYMGGYGMNSVAFFGLSCITVGDVLDERDEFEILVKEIPDERVYYKVILDQDRVRGAVIMGNIINVSAMNRLLRKKVDVGTFKGNLLEEKFVFAY